MFRWIALAITIVCLLGSSLTSTSVFRGVVLPLATLLMAFVTVMAFAAQRISERARPEVYIPTPEELAAIEARRKAAQADAEGKDRPDS